MAEFQALNSNAAQVISGSLSSADLQAKIDDCQTVLDDLNARVTSSTAEKATWESLKTQLDAV